MVPRRYRQTLVLGAALLLSACAAKEPLYDTALPAPRAAWDKSPLVPVTPPLDLLPSPVVLPPIPPPVPPQVPSPQERDLWRPAPKPCKGKRCPSPAAQTVAQANAGALVKPTRAHTAGGTSGMI